MTDFKSLSIHCLYFVHGFNVHEISKIKEENKEHIQTIINEIDLKTEYFQGDYIKSKMLFKKYYNSNI